MGKEILYCNRCGKQLGGDDFTRGRAHTFDNRQFCAGCLPKKFDTPKPAPVPKTSRREPSSVRLMTLPPPPKPSRSALFVSLAGAGLVVVLLVVFMLTPSATPAPAPASPPSQEAARKAIEQAREFGRRNPQALDETLVLWDQAVAVAANTPFAGDAKRERDGAVARRKEKRGEELQALEGKIQERLKAEQFGAAVDLLEEAKKRHESPEWTASISSRVGEVREAANKLYPDVKSKGIAAQAVGDSVRVRELRTRMASWARPDLMAAFEKELAGIVPREPPPTGAVVLFRFPHEGPTPRPYRPHGTLKDGTLVAPVYHKYGVMAGFESLKPHFFIPEEGEFWLTYSSNSPQQINVRLRVVRGDKTVAHDYPLKKPETGRPVRVKLPLRQFMDFNNKLIGKGDEVSTIYLEQVDLKADLVFYEVLVFRTKE